MPPIKILDGSGSSGKGLTPPNPSEPVTNQKDPSIKQKALIFCKEVYITKYFLSLMLQRFEIFEAINPIEAQNILDSNPDMALIFYYDVNGEGESFAKNRTQQQAESTKFILMGKNVEHLKDGVFITETFEKPLPGQGEKYVDILDLLDKIFGVA